MGRGLGEGVGVLDRGTNPRTPLAGGLSSRVEGDPSFVAAISRASPIVEEPFTSRHRKRTPRVALSLDDILRHRATATTS